MLNLKVEKTESGKTMRAKINKLSKGIFDKKVPWLELSEGMIEGTVQTDGVLSGSFVIKSTREARGVLYTDTNRIALQETSFVGKQAEIHYEIDSAGIPAGEKIKGCVWIISDGGELTLPYEIQVEAPFALTSMGKIRNTFHFTNLVRNYYEEALRLFRSQEFADIFLSNTPSERVVYEGLIKGSSADMALEEFLVYINKKSKIMLTVDEAPKEYFDFTHSVGDTITLTKSSWGYLPIEVEADGEFIYLEKKSFTTEIFAGSVYQLPYTIEETKVHAGLNLGQIVIRTPYQELKADIVVKRSRESEAGDRAKLRTGLSELANQYFAFRLHRINTENWCRRSLKLIEYLISYEEAPLYLELVRIQLLLTQKKNGEAGFLIKHIEERVHKVKDAQPELYAYFLYIKVLHSRDSRVLKETLLTVRRMYEGGHDAWQILWVLLYLDEEYTQNRSLKLARLKEQYGKGSRSPFLYYEACTAMNEQPALIRVLNGFELQAAWWGARNEALSEKAALQIAELSNMEKRWNPVLFRILAAFYEKYKNKMILESILSLLLRESRIGADYFAWYEQGVLNNCNLTGMYEAYLHSLPEDYAEPIPKLAAMYLAFDDSLGDDAKKTLYENLLRYDQKNTAILQNHLPSIEQFAAGQIMMGRVDRKLAFIYKKVVGRLLLNEELAKTYPQILLSRYIYLEGKQGRVIVIHKECEGEIAAPLKNGEAYIPVYTDDAAVFYEDMQGRRFLPALERELLPLMNEETVVRSCYDMCQGDELLWLHICEKEGIYRTSGEAGIDIYKRAVVSTSVRRYYRNQLYQKILEYYMENYDGDKLEKQLLEMDMAEMRPKERSRIIELLINRSMYEEACQALKRYGYEMISVNRLMKLCIYLLWAQENVRDSFLLELCSYVFTKGKYDETILGYMLKYYCSTTKNMLRLWQAARDFSVDTVNLEERLITQMLFTESYAVRAVDVFEDYYYNSTNQILVKAYLAQQSYQYFMDNLIVSDKIFFFIEKEYWLHEKEVTDICRLALLRYYSEQTELTQRQIELSGILMDQFLKGNKRFGFYKKFERYMVLPPYLRDKTIVEYQSNTENVVQIHYMLDTGISSKKVYQVERMEKSYSSFYIKEIILFYGEHLQYYIGELGEDGECLTESDAILMDRFDVADGESRYHLLNDICACMEMRDVVTLRELMDSYSEKCRLTEEFELW